MPRNEERSFGNPVTLIALHGFLGKPSDWNLGIQTLRPWPIQMAQSLEHWALAFNQSVSQLTDSPRHLLGYSMGGRLALHAILQNPSLWSSGILISTHPGLTSPNEKAFRYQRDCHWAERFLKDSWSVLMEDWENQGVFSSATYHFKRQEEDYQRVELASQLRSFSLGLQNDLREEIMKLSIPLLWLSGKRDLIYQGLAQEIASNHPFSTHISIPQAAHRVPWEAKQVFPKAIKNHLTHFFSYKNM